MLSTSGRSPPRRAGYTALDARYAWHFSAASKWRSSRRTSSIAAIRVRPRGDAQ